MRSNKKSILITFAALLASSIPSFAQFFKPIAIDYNVGVVRRSSDDIVHPKEMRLSARYDFCSYEKSEARVRHYYLEVKPEFQITRKLALDAGVRLTCSYGKLENDSRYAWRIEENGIDTYLFTIDQVIQKTLYVGIPVGLRLAFADLDRVSPFIKFGTSFNFRVANSNRIDAVKSSMRRYEKEAEKQLGTPDGFAIPFYISGGVQCGPDGMINVEIMMPYWLKHANTFSMARFSGTGLGLSVGVRVPQFRGNE